MYEDGEKVVYRYDNSGALAQVEDYATGILTKYMYDLSDRLMMYEEEAGEQNHRVRYYYDSMNNLTIADNDGNVCGVQFAFGPSVGIDCHAAQMKTQRLIIFERRTTWDRTV